MTNDFDALVSDAADIPTIWNVTLMRWIPGRLLGRYLATQNLENMGRLFADLLELIPERRCI